MFSFRAVAAVVASGLLGSCSVVGEGDGGESPSGTDRVVLVTHESFALPKDVLEEFERESGYELVVRAAGDAGSLATKLSLTSDNPTGDVAFGIDNTFASRTLDAGVFAEHGAELPAGAAGFALDGDAADLLAPVDEGNVCVNVDDVWFSDHDLAPPVTLDDLTDPAYEDLFVVPAASTSSPGLAFLLSTVAEYGEDWPDYWARLMDNGAKLVDGWSDAYFTDFTAGGGKGSRPIVVSYDSSPAFTVPKGADESTTSALLDTCFQQVEYAGVLAGADNPEGGRVLLEFLLSDRVQAELPESMYVFPVSDRVELPADWARYAEQPATPYEVDPVEIAENRETWLQTWTDVTTQ